MIRLVLLVVLLCALAGATAAVASDAAPVVPLQQPALVMDCEAEQVDLNHASLEQLMTLPDVSRPVAERLIESRPHDRVADLEVVPGIGPEKAVQIRESGLACSTPLTLPPPADDACTERRIDLNNENSRSAVAEIFGGPTADRVVEARPFPDVDHALVTLARGVGPGKARKHADALCVTPVPKISGGVNYSWAYSETGGRADHEGYSLVAPPGVLDDPIGQWLKIDPLPTPSSDLPGSAWPSADFHIFGSWVGDGDEVFVTSPAGDYEDDLPGTDWVPILLHYDDASKATGEVLSGDRIHIDPASRAVTGHVSDLSPIDWAVAKANWLIEPTYGVLFGVKFPAPGCGSASWTEVPNTNKWTHDGANLFLQGARLDLPGNEVPFGGFPIKHCVGRADGGSARTVLRNATGTVMKLEVLTGDGTISAGPQPFVSPIPEVFDPIASAVSSIDTGDDVYLSPGGDGGVTVAAGYQVRVDMTSDPLRSHLLLWADQAFGWSLDELAKIPGLNRYVTELTRSISVCAYNQARAVVGGSSSPVTIAREMLFAIEGCINNPAIYEEVVRRATAAGATAAQLQTAYGILDGLRDLKRVLSIGGFVYRSAEPLAYVGSSPIRLSHQEAKPQLDSKQRPIRDACVQPSADGLRWIIDEECQDAYYRPATQPPPGSKRPDSTLPDAIILRDGNENRLYYYPPKGEPPPPGENFPITTGGLYLCLAKHYAVDWNYDPIVYRRSTIFVTPPTCDDGLRDNRPLTRGELAQSAYLLREPNGRVWVVSSDGSRMEIPSGREFNCAVAPPDGYIEHHVWDQVPTAHIEGEWPTVKPYNISFCPGF